MHIEDSGVRPPGAKDQLIDLKAVKLVPQYQLVLQMQK
jgi:hypothetical protein